MMTHQRRFVLLMAVVVSGGSLAMTGAYAIHLRSESYRRSVEADLAAFFQLPCDVGDVKGHTFSSRKFENVVIHLPDRRDQVFSCATAICHEGAGNGHASGRLELANGSLTLGSDRWQRGDYRTIFESGMGHDFSALEFKHISLSNFVIGFNRGNLALRCAKAAGEVDIGNPAEGVARLEAFELNGLAVPDGVSIVARFNGRNGLDVTSVALELPSVPLASIGLENVLKGSITRGRFAGTVRYVNPAEGDAPEVWISGRLDDAALAELTRATSLGAIEADVSVQVDGARVAESLITHLRGRGRLSNLKVATLGPVVGFPALSGRASFSLDPVDLEMGNINRLRLEGEIQGVSLEELLKQWGPGRATGELSVRVENFDVEDNGIKSADIDVDVRPIAGEPGLISRELVLKAAEKVLNFNWPSSIPQSLLPENLEYTKFGMRLLIRDNQLRVLGSHGANQETILTIRVFGQSFGIVKQPTESIDLTPRINEILGRIRTYDPDRVREWLRAGPPEKS